MRLSTSIDTVLGDVFAETTSASETIAAEPHQGLMTFVRGSPGEAATASALAQSAARSGLLATWHAHVAPDTCLLVSLKVHRMHTQTRAAHICLRPGQVSVLLGDLLALRSNFILESASTGMLICQTDSDLSASQGTCSSWALPL